MKNSLPGGRALPWIAGLLIGTLWIAALGSRPLFNPDEGRYAEIPREMLAGGDWIIPHLNGLAYIEKPPLQYWITAAIYHLFGAGQFTARLYPTLCAIGCVAIVAFVGSRGRTAGAGARAAFFLVSMLLFVVLAQLLTLDMSLTFFLTLGLGAFIMAQRATMPGEEATPQMQRYMLLVWLAIALGVLTKGVVAAAIPAAVLVIYSLWTRDLSPWRQLSLRAGLPLFLLVTVPWHYLAARRLGDFLGFYFVHEHLARYLTPSAQRSEPWWFFIAVFALGTLPWGYPALRTALTGWRGPRTAGFSDTHFLWVWVIFIGVFFSLSDSKLIPYVLPALPAMALLLAENDPATLRLDARISAILSLLIGLVLLGVALRWPQLIAHSDRRVYFEPLMRPLLSMAALLGLSGAYGLAYRGSDVGRVVLVLATGWCLAALLMLKAASAVAPVYSGIEFVPPLKAIGTDTPIYSVGTYDQSLPFYLGRTVQLVHFRGELDYGLQKNPAGEISDINEFIDRWRDGSQAFALMQGRLFDELQSQGVPMRLVKRAASRVLVARE